MLFQRGNISREHLGIFFCFHHCKTEFLPRVTGQILVCCFPTGVFVAGISGGIAENHIPQLVYNLVLAFTAESCHIMQVYLLFEV